MSQLIDHIPRYISVCDCTAIQIESIYRNSKLISLTINIIFNRILEGIFSFSLCIQIRKFFSTCICIHLYNGTIVEFDFRFTFTSKFKRLIEPQPDVNNTSCTIASVSLLCIEIFNSWF